MKKQSKLAIVALIAVLVVVFAHFSLAAQMLGDVDGNGRITASDARLALRASARLETLTAEQQEAADVNFDDKVTAVDARIILRVSARLEEFAERPTEPTTEPTTDPVDSKGIDFVDGGDNQGSNDAILSGNIIFG